MYGPVPLEDGPAVGLCLPEVAGVGLWVPEGPGVGLWVPEEPGAGFVPAAGGDGNVMTGMIAWGL